jgi:tetratricopeptide (TPR) repeat protein
MHTNTILPVSPLDESLRACDRQHHYYHYQSSVQYLWLARTYEALGEYEEARVCYDKAIFQDHWNREAIIGKQQGFLGFIEPPTYDKHPLFDLEFCTELGISPTPASLAHDDAVHAMLRHDYESAIHGFDRAIQVDLTHSNSYFGKGKCAFLMQDYILASICFREAIRLSHLAHDGYHRHASDLHAQRARWYERKGEVDLAIADYSKALDLNTRNLEARTSRGLLYQVKGNTRMAEADLL